MLARGSDAFSAQTIRRARRSDHWGLRGADGGACMTSKSLVIDFSSI